MRARSVMPGSGPIKSVRRRKPMVPPTDSVIRHQSGSVSLERRVGTVKDSVPAPNDLLPAAAGFQGPKYRIG